MSSEELKNQNNKEKEEEPLKPDPVEVKMARNVIQSFRKTFSLIKLYPPENPSVEKAIDLFSGLIKGFLDEYEELIIKIGEFNFSYKEEIAFQDEEKRKSLPFLFYRDGVRELSFHKGLDKEELHYFFEIINKVSDLPPEEADIVNSLWEKDLVHIRYFAIDEFLKSDIGEAGEEIGPFDRMEFSKGHLKLTPKDEELYKKAIALRIHPGKEKGEGELEGEPGESLGPATQVPTIEKDEIPEIESMLSSSRQTVPLNELVALLFEFLFFEERSEQFSDLIDVLIKCHKKVVEKSDFSLALSILDRVQELKKILSSKSEERVKLLERIPNSAKEESSITYLRELYSGEAVKNFDDFFQYLESLGPSAFPVIIAIWEESKFPFSRQKASLFLKEVGQKDLGSLLNLARGKGASLAKEVINILASAGERKEIAQLESFVNHPSKDIRLDVIQTLGKSENETANKILIKFLSDKDGEIRSRALMNLKYLGDKATLDYVMQSAQEKNFKERSRMEREAILNFLARTKSSEASALLQSILKKWSIFSRFRQNETRLCAVSALEAMATPEALIILKEGTKIRNRAIRRACKLALRKIAPKEEPKENTKSEQDGKEGLH